MLEREFLDETRGKKRGFLNVLFQLMVFSSFWRSYLLPIRIAGTGNLYLFRIVLPAFWLFYVIWLWKEKQNPFKMLSKIEKLFIWTELFLAILSLFSIIRAIDVVFTVQRAFNFIYDMLFASALLLFVRNKKRLRQTLINIFLNVFVLIGMGIWETLRGGIFVDRADHFKRTPFLTVGNLQPPIVSYWNPNDFVSALLFLLPLLIGVLMYCYMKEKSSLWVTGGLIFTLFGGVFYNAVYAMSRIGIFVCYLYLVVIGMYCLLRNRKFLFVPVFMICSVFLIQGMKNYEQIRREFQILKEQKTDYTDISTNEVQKDPQKKEKPNKVSLKEEFSDSQEFSGGIRVALLKTAFSVLVDSKGLGVGLGNTEMIAKQLWELGILKKTWSIHCFPVRVLADFGVFLVVPVLAIALQVISCICEIYREAKKKNLNVLYMLFYLLLGSLLAMPFMTTMSSDAQDILAMWIFFAAIIKVCGLYKSYQRGEII